MGTVPPVLVPRRTLHEWLTAFGALHERYKLGTLAPGDRSRYLVGREECARLVRAAQNQALLPGQTPRRLRVNRALPVRVAFADRTENAVTLEVSARGFGAFVGQAPSKGERASISLAVPGGERLTCAAQVVGVSHVGRTVRASFELTDLDAEQQERLEVFLLDVVLEQLRAAR